MTTKKRTDNEGSIYFDKTNNCYFVSMTVGHDSKTGKRIRKKRRAATKREALEKLDELRQKYTSASYVEADKMSVSEWLDKWYSVYVEPRIRESTKDSYMHKINIAKKYFGKVVLSKLTTTDIQAVILIHLRDHFRTAQFFRVIIKAALKRAVTDHLLKDNPADNLELPPRPPRKKFAKPTGEAWKALLNAKTPYYYWRMAVLTEYMTGMRRSELLGLRWQDVEFCYDNGKALKSVCFHIRHGLTIGQLDGNKHHEIVLDLTKTAESRRDLVLPPEYGRELLEYRKEQLKVRMRSPLWTDNDYVFCREDGSAVQPASFSSAYIRIRRRLGLATTFHMLRHDMACRMKQSKRFDMKDIQAQLGHSAIQVTMDIYTHIDDDDKNEVSCWLADDMAGLMSKKKTGGKTKKLTVKK